MRRGPETGAACSLKSPLEAKANRSPRFALLDAMILAGWGDVPFSEIPHNWLECAPPSKYHGNKLISEAQAVDLERIKLDNQPDCIERVEAMNLVSEGHCERAQQILQIMQSHRKPQAQREQEMREKHRQLRRAHRSERQREAITRAWSNPDKFQSRRRVRKSTQTGLV